LSSQTCQSALVRCYDALGFFDRRRCAETAVVFIGATETQVIFKGLASIAGESIVTMNVRSAQVAPDVICED
jgi:hypothetical protein